MKVMKLDNFMMSVFIALCVSFYRFIKDRNNFNRMTFWLCSAVLVIVLAVDFYIERVPDNTASHKGGGQEVIIEQTKSP